MPLRPASEAPVYREVEAAEDVQDATPASFHDIPPALIQALPCVSLRMQPAPPALCLAEAAPKALHARGRLWLTEKEITFLPEDTQSMHGFTLSYPSVALHAVSRTVPDDMQLDGLYREACLYCQLDDHPEQDEEEEDEDEAVKEVWLATPDAETRTWDVLIAVDQLFESLSYGASLHPSVGASSDSHPLAGLGALDMSAVDEETEENDASGDVSEPGKVKSELSVQDVRYRPY